MSVLSLVASLDNRPPSLMAALLDEANKEFLQEINRSASAPAETTNSFLEELQKFPTLTRRHSMEFASSYPATGETFSFPGNDAGRVSHSELTSETILPGYTDSELFAEETNDDLGPISRDMFSNHWGEGLEETLSGNADRAAAARKSSDKEAWQGQPAFQASSVDADWAMKREPDESKDSS